MTELQDVSLHVALAWVFARNDGFLTYVVANEFKDLDGALRDYSADQEAVVKPAVKNSTEAWASLRSSILDRSMEIFGVPFEKGQHINSAGVFGQPYEAEMDVRQRPVAIRANHLSALVLDTGIQEYRLRPEDWVRNGGWWWREVQMELSEVVAAFPPLDGIQGLSGPTERRRRSSALTSAVLQAIDALWDGEKIKWEIVQPKERHAAIAEWIRTNTKFRSVSPKTIDRVFSKLGTSVPNGPN